MKENLLRIALTLVLTASINAPGFTQCKSFIRSKCQPRLKPYNVVEHSYSTTLLSEDKTQVSATFFYGQDYRLLVCSDEALGKVQLNLRDKDNKVVFTTKGIGSIMWDFNVENTQDLTVEVLTPKNGRNAPESGCVSILLGTRL